MDNFETFLLAEIKDSNLGHEFIDIGELVLKKFDTIYALFLAVNPKLKDNSNEDFFSYFFSRLISILINSSAENSDFSEDEKDDFIRNFLFKFCKLTIKLIAIYEQNKQRYSLLN
jgi:hypothetical protein